MSAASNAASSSARSGRRKRSRVSALELAQARRCRRGAGERGNRGGVSVGGEDLTSAGEPQRERARAAEQVRDPFRVRERPLGKLREPRFSRLGRLQESARRQPHQRLAERDARRPALDHDLAVIGDAREIERIRCLRQLLGFRASQRPRAAQIDVEPVERRGDADVERLHQPAEIRR